MYPNQMIVDVRGITTASVTLAANPSLATILTAVGSTVLADKGEGDNQRVAESMRLLNQFCDSLRRLHL